MAGRSRTLATRRGLRRLEGSRIGPGELRQVVAHGGPVEPFGGVELVAVAHGVREALKDDAQIGLRILAFGGGDQFLGEEDPAAGGAGAGELLEDLILGGNGNFAQDVALGFLLRHRDPGVVGDRLLGHRPPLLEFFLADDLRQGQFQVDDRGGVVGIALETFDDKLNGFFRDEMGDSFGFGLLAHQEVLFRQDLHRGRAEGGVHDMPLLAFEIDFQPLGCLVVALDLAEPPAAVHHVRSRFHGLKFGFGPLEGRIFCN